MYSDNHPYIFTINEEGNELINQIMTSPSRRSRYPIRTRRRHDIDDEDDERDGDLRDSYYSDRGLTLRGKVYLLIIVCVIFNIIETIGSVSPKFKNVFRSKFFKHLFKAKRKDIFPPDPLTVNLITLEEPGANAAFIPAKYNYSAEPIRTEFTLPEPTLQLKDETHSGAMSNLLVLVMSARTNFASRKAIRESWALGHPNILFLIGGPIPPEDNDIPAKYEKMVADELRKEQQVHNDILDTIHPDTYKGLPYKLDFAMKFIYRQPTASNHFHWILKVDDNVVVRLKRLQRLVLQKFDYQHPIVIGDIVDTSFKQVAGKWAEDPHYKPSMYPPWPRGASGYVMSQPVAAYLGRAKDLYYYQGEDVSLGIWLEQAHKEFGHKGSDLTWIHSPDFVFDLGCNEPYVITGHDMDPDVIKACFFNQGGDKLPKHKSRIYHQDRQVQLHLQVPMD